MAMKGDFPECSKCTSFQCKDCGLDQILEGTGTVSTLWSKIKLNLFFIFLVFMDKIILLDKYPMPLSIAFCSIIAIIIFVHIKFSIEKNPDANFGQLNFIGNILTFGPIFIHGFITLKAYF